MIISRRVNGSKSPLWSDSGTARERANHSALAILENVKGGGDTPTLDPLAAVNPLNNYVGHQVYSNQVSPDRFGLPKPLSPIIGLGHGGAKSPQAILRKLTRNTKEHMTLEEKILNGVFKPDI